MDVATIRARYACAVLGAALMAWGAAPSIVTLVISPNAWRLEQLITNAVTVLFGIGFLMLTAVFSRRTTWPLWASFTGSLALLLANLGLFMFIDGARLSVFPLLLTGAAATTCSLALVARRSADADPGAQLS